MFSRQSGQHQPRHGDIDKGLTAGVRALKIAREPTVARDPGIGAFDDPVTLPPKVVFCLCVVAIVSSFRDVLV
jgi:hypothetical protein